MMIKKSERKREEKEQITKQPVFNIGIVGHIDHGKTTLLHRLTGKWADTHSEELKRGITIKLGYADCIIRKCPKCKTYNYTTQKECKCGGKSEPIKYVSFVDAPGHEMLMATMLSGAAIMDAAILVIAANESCPRPQTKEHLIALEAKGINNIIIIQNKVDLVTKEQALENYKQIKEFIKGTIAENSKIIPISAQQSINLDLLLEAIDKIEIPKRDVKSKPIFFIARSFDINKPGILSDEFKGGVIGGILKQGTLKVGQEIEIKPGVSEKKHDEVKYHTVKTKILSLYSGNNKLEEAIPSGSLAIQTSLDPRLTKTDKLSGCTASLTGILPELTDKIKMKVDLFKNVVGAKKETKVEEIRPPELLLLSINTAISVGIVKRSVKGEVDLVLKIPIVPLKDSKIGIARNIEGKWRLIGSGILI